MASQNSSNVRPPTLSTCLTCIESMKALARALGLRALTAAPMLRRGVAVCKLFYISTYLITLPHLLLKLNKLQNADQSPNPMLCVMAFISGRGL